MTTHRFSCPQCQKPYVARAENLALGENFFECPECQCEFIMNYDPQNEIQLQLHNLSSTLKKSCPHCYKDVGQSDVECIYCGVLFEKYQAKKQGPAELVQAWKSVVDDYQNEEKHLDFIKAAERRGATDFAVAKYSALKQALPTDEFSNRYLTELTNKAHARLKTSTDTKSRSYRDWNYRLILFWVGHVSPFLISAVLVLIGLSNIELRNLVGIGFMLALFFSGVFAHWHGLPQKLFQRF